ncbi:MAG: alpha-2-macroglobulin family protein [Bacteroidota bacterium]
MKTQLEFMSFLKHPIFILLIALTMPLFNFGQGDSFDFEAAWKKVDELTNDRQIRSAKGEVLNIQQAADKEGNDPQYIKSLLYQFQFDQTNEEKSDSSIMARMMEEVKNGSPIRKAITISLLAEMYHQYFQNHRWEIMNRTQLAEVAKDYKTWDTRTFAETISSLYLKSVEQKDALSEAKIDDYALLLNRGEESAKYRPTVYDLLAHRAMDFFNESGLMLPVSPEDVNLNENNGFSDIATFIGTSYANSGTEKLHPTVEILKIYQSLLSLHLNDNPYALMDANLSRLKFVRNKINQEEAYKNALEALIASSNGNATQADAKIELAKWYKSRGNNVDVTTANEDQKTAFVKAHQLVSEVLKAKTKGRAATDAEATITDIEQKYISLQVEEFSLPNENMRALLQYRNFNRAYFRVVPLTKKLKKDLEGLRYIKDERLANLLKRQKVLKEWNHTLPNPKDYYNHRVEVKIPALPAGDYLLMTSDNRSFSINKHALTYSVFSVSSLSHVYHKNENTHYFYLVDRESGKPLSNVKAKLYRLDTSKGRYREKKEYPFEANLETDKNGGLVISQKYRSEKLYVVFQKGNEEWKAYGQQYGYYNEDVAPTERELTQIFTDRAIYRPGQTIYFKGIQYGYVDRFKPYIRPNKNVEVSLYDANGQKVSSLNLTTNEYGSFHGSFTAPSGGLNGQMRIQTAHSSKYFRVEEYKRPTFEVKIDPLEGSYTLHEKVEVTGKAEAFSGAKIGGANVNYAVIRKTEVPWWFRYWYGFSEPDKEIVNGSVETAEDGTFKIEFDAIPGTARSNRKDFKPVYNYLVKVDVVDISGETHDAQGSVRVGKHSRSVALNVEEMIDINEPGKMGLVTNNLNGQFLATKGKISFVKLDAPDKVFRNRRWAEPDQFIFSQNEYYKLFPHDVYKNENKRENWAEASSPAMTQSVNTANNKEFDLEGVKKLEKGSYKIIFETEEEGVKDFAYITLFDSKDKTLPNPVLLSHELDKDSYEPGDVAKLELKTTEKKIWVLYHVLKDNKILDKQWIELKKGSETIDIPIVEAYRGNLGIHLSYFYNNEMFTKSMTVNVPWTNKQLKLEWSTFRSPLQPGQKEQWKLHISGSMKDKVSAEMVATLYDASLDEFVAHNMYMSLYPYSSTYMNVQSQGYSTHGSNTLSNDWNKRSRYYYSSYDRLNLFGFYFGSQYYAVAGSFSEDAMLMDAAPAPRRARTLAKGAKKERAVSGAMPMMEESDKDGIPDLKEKESNKPGNSFDDNETQKGNEGDSPITPRRNLNETAFFFPQLETDENGDIILNFTMPEALTRWKFLGLAHTKDLEYGTLTGETLTQKELMVVPNLPRFFREGDKMTITSKVVNMTDSVMVGSAEMKLFDAADMRAVDAAFAHNLEAIPFSIPAKGSEVVSWNISIPQNQQAIAVQVFAKGGAFTDGEEKILPVLTNRMLVTESLPFALKSKERKKKLTFTKLAESGNSESLSHHKVTLDVTSNPAWYAVQSLPYLMEYPFECTEQVFSRFYANALATHIANDKPAIKQIFEQWKQAGSEESFLSNLEKNQELKYALLSETPWVMEAQDQSERKKRLGLLFDLNRMSDEFQRTKSLLAKRQNSNGGFSWFPGMKESPYVTMLVATGMAHLQKLGVDNVSGNPEVSDMLSKAVGYMDRTVLQNYKRLKASTAKMDENHLGYFEIQYLYMRSFYGDLPMLNGEEAYNYYYGQAETYWNKQNTYMQGMLSLVFDRSQDKELAMKLIKGLKESSVQSDAKGMYWKDNKGWFWWQAPIERQALLIEAFSEITEDQDAIDDMRYWLLINKRTNDWETTRATVAACNALLMNGNDWIGDQQLVEVKLGDIKVDPEKLEYVEAGSGHYQVEWAAGEVNPDMGNIVVKKPGKSPAWGAVFWQYFENLDKITFAETPLSIKKTVYKEIRTANGPQLVALDKSELKQGDKLVVRIELRVNQAMEYVHMKDMRAAGLEPMNVLSQYKYQGGLGYYESTRDAATDFFFDYLPEGTFVFEYPLRVNLPGDFSNGITTIQCMYAPEFTSHSEGIRVDIK